MLTAESFTAPAYARMFEGISVELNSTCAIQRSFGISGGGSG